MLASARNELQLDTVVEEVERRVAEHNQRRPERREGTKETGWMVLDYGDVIVHAFTSEQRDHYDLERLWSDAPVLTDPELVGAHSGRGRRGDQAAS